MKFEKDDIIIYDFDNTLVNSKQNHIDAYIAAIKKLQLELHNHETTDKEETLLRIKMNEKIDYGIETAIKDFFTEFDILLIKEFKRNLLDITKIKINKSVFDDMPSNCKYIITNASYLNVTDILQLNGINVKTFKDIITPEGFIKKFKKKPDANMGLYLIQKHNLDVTKCVYVGDSDVDKEFAANCGFRFKNINE